MLGQESWYPRRSQKSGELKGEAKERPAKGHISQGQVSLVAVHIEKTLAGESMPQCHVVMAAEGWSQQCVTSQDI